MLEIVDVAMITGLAVVLLAIGWTVWQQWRQMDGPARAETVRGAARRLVEAAEQIYREPGSGKLKYSWVMGRLQRRFPDVDWDELTEYLEAACLRLNVQKRRNHAGPEQ
jgi:hypothetical protein